MLSIIYYQNLDLLQAKVCQLRGLNYLKMWLCNELIIRQEISSWSELSIFFQTQDVFLETTNPVFLLSSNLSIDKKVLEFLKNLETPQISQDVILATDSLSFFKQLKKDLLKGKNSLEFLELKKIDLQLAQKLGQEFLSATSQNLDWNLISNYLEKFEDYSSLLNFLDLLGLTSKPKEWIKNSFSEVEVPLFWLKFTPQNYRLEVKNWQKRVTNEEASLITSLLFSKLEKWGGGKKNAFQKELILSDQNSKKILPMITSLNLFLYKVKHDLV